MYLTWTMFCYSENFSEHLENVTKAQMHEHGIKLHPKKWELFKRQIRFVGRMVSGEGIHVDPKDLEAVLKLKEREPKTGGEVRTLLGFLSHYRSFIENFSHSKYFV